MLTNWLERTVQLFLVNKGGMDVKLRYYNDDGIMVEHEKGQDFVPYSAILLMRLRNEETKPGRNFERFSDEEKEEDEDDNAR
jgi:hypothetical protein